jgi:hypothetical protein
VFFRGNHTTAYTESTQRSELHRVSIEKPAAAKQTSLKLDEVELKADDGTPIAALHIVEEK